MRLTSVFNSDPHISTSQSCFISSVIINLPAHTQASSMLPPSRSQGACIALPLFIILGFLPETVGVSFVSGAVIPPSDFYCFCPQPRRLPPHCSCVRQSRRSTPIPTCLDIPCAFLIHLFLPPFASTTTFLHTSSFLSSSENWSYLQVAVLIRLHLFVVPLAAFVSGYRQRTRADARWCPPDW
jgi:hypothetical protein